MYEKKEETKKEKKKQWNSPIIQELKTDKTNGGPAPATYDDTFVYTIS